MRCAVRLLVKRVGLVGFRVGFDLLKIDQLESPANLMSFDITFFNPIADNAVVTSNYAGGFLERNPTLKGIFIVHLICHFVLYRKFCS
jgi:hypothetical protein